MNQTKVSFLLFDACQIGVVLRALALVQVAVGIGSLLHSQNPASWLQHFSLLIAATLPALLIWLLAACALKNVLQYQVALVQWSFGLLLGLLCGLFAYATHLFITAGNGQKTVWLAAGLAGIAFAAVLINMLTMRYRARQPAATLAKLAELQSRIRPHFLFNTLNSAIALVRQDPAKAERMLEDLSDLFHHALKDPNSESTLGKEISIARQYLDIEQIRFGERLRTVWNIDEDALDASVPPLILQPLVENAIKHGIEPSVDGGEVHVLVRRRDERVFVRISNRIPPRGGSAASTAGNGIALKNVQSRLKLLHDLNVQFRVRRKDDFFEVGFTLPAASTASGQVKPVHES